MSQLLTPLSRRNQLVSTPQVGNEIHSDEKETRNRTDSPLTTGMDFLCCLTAFRHHRPMPIHSLKTLFSLQRSKKKLKVNTCSMFEKNQLFSSVAVNMLDLLVLLLSTSTSAVQMNFEVSGALICGEHEWIGVVVELINDYGGILRGC